MDRTAAFYSQPSYVQRGGGLPVYSGSRRQRGGSILGAIKSLVMPFLGNLKQNAIRHAKQEAWNMAKGVAQDAMRGKNVVNSIKTRGIRHVKQLGKKMGRDTLNSITGPTSRIPTSRKRKSIPKKAPAKKRRRVVKNF